MHGLLLDEPQSILVVSVAFLDVPLVTISALEDEQIGQSTETCRSANELHRLRAARATRRLRRGLPSELFPHDTPSNSIIGSPKPGRCPYGVPALPRGGRNLNSWQSIRDAGVDVLKEHRDDLPPEGGVLSTTIALSYRMLNVLDEFTHEYLAIRIARRLKAIDVIDVLSDLFFLRGIPSHIRSDNGPEFVAEAVREWITAVGAKTAYIERGSPWENGYIESFNACATNCSTARSSTLCARPRSSSRAGDAITIQSGPTPQSDTNRRHGRYSCPLRRKYPLGCGIPSAAHRHRR
jgi:transposase InsO family protein